MSNLPEETEQKPVPMVSPPRNSSTRFGIIRTLILFCSTTLICLLKQVKVENIIIVAWVFTPIPDYNGTFNGNGHKIIGLNINRPREENIGLFASILSNATISKLGMINSNIYGGNDYTGGICGVSQGLIEYCYNTGNVTGRYYGVTGGIVGGGGRTECCYNTGYIRMIEMPGTGSGGISLIGGISGGTLAVNCYNAGGCRRLW